LVLSDQIAIGIEVPVQNGSNLLLLSVQLFSKLAGVALQHPIMLDSTFISRVCLFLRIARVFGIWGIILPVQRLPYIINLCTASKVRKP
jgi:hypothetical protein